MVIKLLNSSCFMALRRLLGALPLLVLTPVAWAGAFQDCAKETDLDQRNLCKGIAALSPTFCKDIKNGETRNHCYAKVRDGQRKFTWKPEPLNESNSTKK
jgi:hypothetical protein